MGTYTAKMQTIARKTRGQHARLFRGTSARVFVGGRCAPSLTRMVCVRCYCKGLLHPGEEQACASWGSAGGRCAEDGDGFWKQVDTRSLNTSATTSKRHSTQCEAIAKGYSTQCEAIAKGYSTRGGEQSAQVHLLDGTSRLEIQPALRDMRE